MADGRGGKREGAGRKKGSANLKTIEIANKAAEQGLTPLEVMLEVMGDLLTIYREAKNREQVPRVIQVGEILGSQAKDIAPYMHPRMPQAVLTKEIPEGDVTEEDQEILEMWKEGNANNKRSKGIKGAAKDKPTSLH